MIPKFVSTHFENKHQSLPRSIFDQPPTSMSERDLSARLDTSILSEGETERIRMFNIYKRDTTDQLQKNNEVLKDKIVRNIKV